MLDPFRFEVQVRSTERKGGGERAGYAGCSSSLVFPVIRSTAFLGSGCGLQDEAVVAFQLLDPVLQVGRGVAFGVVVADAGDGAKEGGTRFSDQFFPAVEVISEAGAEGAVQSGLMSGAVHQFMEEGAVVQATSPESGSVPACARSRWRDGSRRDARSG